MEPRQGRTSEAAVFVDEFNALAGKSGLREEAGSLNELFLKKRLFAIRFDLLRLRAENEVLRAELRAANDRHDRLADHVKDIYASRGWKVVYQLRRLRDFYRRVVHVFWPTDRPPTREESR
jgi:hypothetical protein